MNFDVFVDEGRPDTSGVEGVCSMASISGFLYNNDIDSAITMYLEDCRNEKLKPEGTKRQLTALAFTQNVAGIVEMSKIADGTKCFIAVLEVVNQSISIRAAKAAGFKQVGKYRGNNGGDVVVLIKGLAAPVRRTARRRTRR